MPWHRRLAPPCSHVARKPALRLHVFHSLLPPLMNLPALQESGDLKAELAKAQGAPSLQERLKQLVNQQPVMLFMKVSCWRGAESWMI